MNRLIRTVTLGALGAGLLGAPLAAAEAPGAAVVHPEATLKSELKAIAAGAELPLQGEKFIAGDPVKLLLQGALAEYELLEVTPEEGGTFAIDVAVPWDVRPGQYRVVALASDGEVAASLDLTVLAASEVAPAMMDDDRAAEGGGAQDHDGSDAMARADERPIERARAGIEWGVIGLLVGFAGGAGVGLIRR